MQMSQYDSPRSGRDSPFPKYLLEAGARSVLAEIEAEGYLVELTSPGAGSACVRITTPDGHMRESIGRPNELEDALRSMAEALGLDV